MLRSRCPNLSIAVMLVVATAALAGCAEPQTAGDASTITINPATVTVTIPTGTCDVTTFSARDFQAVVRNAKGEPLNDINVHFSISNPAIFFLDANGAPIPADVFGISRVTRATDENGVVRVPVGALNCKTGDDLFGTSGTALGKARVEVVEG